MQKLYIAQLIIKGKYRLLVSILVCKELGSCHCVLTSKKTEKTEK